LLLDSFQNLEIDLIKIFNGNFEYYLSLANNLVPNNRRIDYWFLPEQKNSLSVIFFKIMTINNQDIRDFFLVSFAQILKSCSIWLQKSIKPTRDQNKKIVNPLNLFLNQARKMVKKHFDFNKILNFNIIKNIDKYRIIKCGDSRTIPCNDNRASLIVTSPPYTTSYEYADLHQLPSLWFGYLDELSEFRKKFIGSGYKNRETIDLKSRLADEIIEKLGKNKKGIEVRNYFADMLESFIEMKRILKTNGKICIVIGNTEFHGVNIYNSEVFLEQLENIGFKNIKVIHREIPSKMLPSTRDKKSGQFVKVIDEELKFAYPTEYILVMEKQ